jgi:hypothetical protein
MGRTSQTQAMLAQQTVAIIFTNNEPELEGCSRE